jgi:hypothetical protein
MQQEADPESDRHPDPHTQEHHEQKSYQGAHVILLRLSPLMDREPLDRHAARRS